MHATEVFLKPLHRLAIFDADPVPQLSLPPNEESKSKSPLAGRSGRWLALHPGSGSEQKNWPESNWRELIGRLQEISSSRFLLIGGEAEGDRLSRLTASLDRDRIRLAQNLPLVELARTLQQCFAFVGHDSGISHLAAAVGLRGLVLWGHSNEKTWRPRSERFTLLRARDGLPKLAVEEVFNSVSSLTSIPQPPEIV